MSQKIDEAVTRDIEEAKAIQLEREQLSRQLNDEWEAMQNENIPAEYTGILKLEDYQRINKKYTTAKIEALIVK